MGQLCNIARCKECAEKDPDDWEAGEFCIVLEYLTKEEIIKKVRETKCPECGSENWVLTDATSH